MRIDVCIASYRRPESLALTLASLIQQKMPPEFQLRIIVIDNDAAESAADTVALCASQSPWPIIYAVEPRKNIAHARNRALARSDAPWLAFLDDDEVAAPDWLARHYAAIVAHNAEISFGPVIAILPSDAPRWALKGGFYQRRRYPSGTPRSTGAFNNVLMARDVLDRLVHWVDPKFGLSGGEDTEFFNRLGRAGVRMIWCDEAIVSEPVAPKRLRLGWLIQRHYRGGQVFARIIVSDLSMLGVAALVIKRAAVAFIALLLTPLLWPVRREWGVRCLLALMSNGGQVSAVFGGHYNEYA